MADHEIPDLDIPIVETERLILRGFREADVDGLFAIAQDPLIAEYVTYNNAPLREACSRSMALWIGHWALRGFGLWAVEDRSTGTLIGRIGIWRPEGWPGTEVGWLLGRAFWGQGYATEAARASLDWRPGPRRVPLAGARRLGLRGRADGWCGRQASPE